MFSICSPFFLFIMMTLQSDTYANFVQRYCAHKQIFEFPTSENSSFVIKCSNKISYRQFVFSSLLIVSCYIFQNLNGPQQLVSPYRLLNELFLCISEFFMIRYAYSLNMNNFALDFSKTLQNTDFPKHEIINLNLLSMFSN